MALTLTERAAAEVKKVMTEGEYDADTMLRVSIGAGGCSGFSYSLTFDKEFDPHRDNKYEYHGVKVVLEKKRSLYLDQTTIDWYEAAGRRGFTFDNPEEVKSCGSCGCGH